MVKSHGRFRALGALLLVGSVAIATTASGQSWRTMNSSRQMQGESPVEVDVAYGAGTLMVRPGSPSLLYRMELRYDADRSEPVAAWDAERRRLRLGVTTREGGPSARGKQESRSSIELSPTVPLDLELQFGAGEAELELGGLRLHELKLSTGASETRVGWSKPNAVRARRIEIEAGAADLRVTGIGHARADHFAFRGGVGATVLDFGGPWDANASASVKLGVGSVVLRIPRGLGVRIDRRSFMTSFDADDMVKRGNSYFSEGYDRAQWRLTVDVEAALGSVEVEWID